MENSWSKYEIVSRYELFKDLSPQFIEFLANSAYIIHIEKHQNLFHQGEKAKHFYILLIGSIAIQMDASEMGYVTIKAVTPKDIVGWSWLLSPYEWIFTSEALTGSTLLSFDGVRLREFCESNKEFGYQMARRFSLVASQRLKETQTQLLNVLT